MIDKKDYKNYCHKLIDELESITKKKKEVGSQVKHVEDIWSDYEDSYMNISLYDQVDFKILSSFVYDLYKLLPYAHSNLNEVLDVTGSYREFLKGDMTLESYKRLKFDSIEPILKLEFKMKCDQNIYDRTLKTRTIDDYGLIVTETDRELSQFIDSYPSEKLDLIAETIVSAFLHGFISQNRDRRDRKTIRFQYTQGQEAIAFRVKEIFKSRGIEAKIITVTPYEKMTQCHYDHMYDMALYLDEAYLREYLKFYKALSEINSDKLYDVSGYVGIGSFGALEDAPTEKKEALKLSESQEKLWKTMKLQKHLIDDEYIKPSDISFCKITFPNPTIKGNFKDIFDDFVKINTMQSDTYEAYQQTIIDVLDQGDYIHCIGYNGNQTDIMVKMNPLNDKAHQTNFMNCGGDLNIPHGEVFTTPKLTGTNGTLHFKNIFLKGYHYENLRLVFNDGLVTDYMCSNFDKNEDNMNYIEKTLFGGSKVVPMGEFAVGTNTLAYNTLKKHRIVEELPILLVEKMGPHFAIGDPCYAFGEDQTVFNLLDKKEIVAKENEKTALRHENIEEAYVGFHVDMTIPYEELYELKVIGEKEVSLIHKGLFNLPELEKLNEPLRERRFDYGCFSQAIKDFLQALYVQKNRLKKKDYFELETDTLMKHQDELYALFLSDYDQSLLNPEYVYKHYGYDGLLLSAILYDMKQMILDLYRKRELSFNKYLSFMHQVIECIDENRVGQIKRLYCDFKLSMIDELRYGEYISRFLDDIFNHPDLKEKTLFAYGYYVKKEDLVTYRVLAKKDVISLEKLGRIIAKAFDKGFMVSGKDRGERKIVKLEFHLGQEPLMTYVSSHLRLLGYIPKVTRVIPNEPNMKMSLEHKEDQVIYLNQAYAVKKKQKLKDLISDQSKTLKGVCGFARLLQFGLVEDVPKISDEKLKMTESTKSLSKDLINYERKASQGVMPKSEMSYTGAAFPSASIGPEFEDILSEIININSMEPEKHEAIQDIMISVLNKADYVEVKGAGQNETEIRVSIKRDFDLKRETVFKNTGADVNIPVGEVFTSPVLIGTSGVLHVSEAFREAYRYENLKLQFEDGMVTDYACSNFNSLDENRNYIESTLLYPHKSLPMGEFAIGTNTYAYKVSKDFGIIDKLPGLIVEKMGPHFAIGDTCFSYGEDVKVCNHTSGLEMVAKDNEITKKRHEGESVYFNTHTDITIPYEEIAYVRVVSGDEYIDIIKDGIFVLEGTEDLNKYLTED
ncbi:hypothetical protein EZV73_02135 [Acidaminobacter sp. JC074]|uniref:aminopeptidase n=1 Tax=Acidaminobacter sp. JC074 TaxID=2530199 RepID=UPI001F0FAF49|nr:aminopeptidase [Acidaminobacter sp. JC074]MCH4886345.1 hypothetical protein [Acidaminobacter sp. JC074]